MFAVLLVARAASYDGQMQRIASARMASSLRVVVLLGV